MAGASTGIMNLRAMGFETPSAVYEMEDDMTGDDAMASSGIRRDGATRIRAEMERYLRAHEQARQTSASRARSDF